MEKQGNATVQPIENDVNYQNYYVIGLPWQKNEHTGNYSCSWGYIYKYNKDFCFILKKEDDQIIASAFVPHGVVKKAARKVFKHYKKDIIDPKEPLKTITIEKSFPIALIPKKVVHNWMNMDQYKYFKFL